MRVNTRALLSATAIMLVLVIPSAAWAQHKYTQSGHKKPGMPGMKSEMSKMMKSPHHMLMTAHMKTMSEFARTLRDQAVKPEALDVEFARAAVAELRHKPDSKQVAAHTNALLKHFGMMSKIYGGTKAANEKKMEMKM